MKWQDKGGKEFDPAPIGTHVGRCISVIDIGTQEGEYEGKPTPRRQVILGFELPNELIREGDFAGQPFKVSKFYTASLGEKANLRKDLESWRGKQFTKEELEGFDSKFVLGKPCLVTVVHTDKGKAKIQSITGTAKGMEIPAQILPSLFFSLEEYSDKSFDALPKFYQGLICKSPEYQTLVAERTVAPVSKGKTSLSDMDDDIPF